MTDISDAQNAKRLANQAAGASDFPFTINKYTITLADVVDSFDPDNYFFEVPIHTLQPGEVFLTAMGKVTEEWDDSSTPNVFFITAGPHSQGNDLVQLQIGNTVAAGRNGFLGLTKDYGNAAQLSNALAWKAITPLDDAVDLYVNISSASNDGTTGEVEIYIVTATLPAA